MGSYLPINKCSNEHLSTFVDTSDEWVSKRSGIKNRHFVADNEKTSDMAFLASNNALENAQVSKDDIDLLTIVIVGNIFRRYLEI